MEVVTNVKCPCHPINVFPLQATPFKHMPHMCPCFPLDSLPYHLRTPPATGNNLSPVVGSRCWTTFAGHPFLFMRLLLLVPFTCTGTSGQAAKTKVSTFSNVEFSVWEETEECSHVTKVGCEPPKKLDVTRLRVPRAF